MDAASTGSVENEAPAPKREPVRITALTILAAGFLDNISYPSYIITFPLFSCMKHFLDDQLDCLIMVGLTVKEKLFENRSPEFQVYGSGTFHSLSSCENDWTA
ncbi:hypothetical protein [Peribacillus sp. V2I11]|uniref:hypothetical protein n=1 Tax=Peribacillus sp. V2I11 TaxID=3042277 RepID=UPI002783949D|nr:hypothetical protein [Peribacillus sp. V2I11]MDQ0880549.1 hypothetical protein [Peribacillus sp. V2I11]